MSRKRNVLLLLAALGAMALAAGLVRSHLRESAAGDVRDIATHAATTSPAARAATTATATITPPTSSTSTPRASVQKGLSNAVTPRSTATDKHRSKRMKKHKH